MSCVLLPAGRLRRQDGLSAKARVHGMTCRVACQPEPRRHWPTFSVPGLPDGLAYCLVCWHYLTAVELFGACPKNAEGCPVASPITALPDPDGERLADGSPVGVAPTLTDARDLDRARTLGMIRRCAEHQ